MAKLNIVVPHALPQGEALRRIQGENPATRNILHRFKLHRCFLQPSQSGRHRSSTRVQPIPMAA